ncbi:hypothetical protein B1207_07715 [Legionella quinlivanii]|uniref:Uncharacterized protein n=1 Tax=Legionella quinlivanii TaxID=45073 RepID=A0A364LJX6_9GAMM|nr:hypothetical protein B1207_07715 [Legionella quinlivanii]
MDIKIRIYKGIIEYLLKTTNYSLKNIADLIDTSMRSINLAYSEQAFSIKYSSELKLLKLYQAVLQFNVHTAQPYISEKQNHPRSRII